MRALGLGQGVEVSGPAVDRSPEVLTPDAVAFVADLEHRLGPERRALLAARAHRQARLDRGERPDFLPETKRVREDSWRVAPAPPDLQDRRVEITGPVERKMMINAFNSGARVFMADFEDALSPTWPNVVTGQANLIDATRRVLSFESPDGKAYRLGPKIATLMVRPRGWHLVDRHVRVDGNPVSGSLLDAGLFLFHNARELVKRGTGPYLYLPKLEGHLEARLWARVLDDAEDALGLSRGAIKVTVLVETILAAFEMEEILYELRSHIVGLNAGRWDYIFSVIKKFREHPAFLLPDRAQVTMTVPFMRNYTELLVRTCHRRGAHAMGGMAAFVPNRRDPEATELALARVREDKLREARDGFDGTWVAHPDLVSVATTVFDEALGNRPNQLHRARDDVRVDARQLLDVHVPDGAITTAGLRQNLDVALHYTEAWLRGQGAVALHNLMEDAATAEIARSQVWQWIRHNAPLDEGGTVTRERAQAALHEVVANARATQGSGALAAGRFEDARRILERAALGADHPEFLTLLAYDHIDGPRVET